MSNLQFEDDYQGGGYNYQAPSKGIAGFLVDKGIAKDKKTAEIIMLVFAVIGIGLSFIFLRNIYGTPTVNQADIERELEMMEMEGSPFTPGGGR